MSCDEWLEEFLVLFPVRCAIVNNSNDDSVRYGRAVGTGNPQWHLSHLNVSSDF